MTDLAPQFRDLGLESGDDILIHSSLSGMKCEPEDLLDAIMEIIGDDGTLIVPTFNFDWTNNAPDGIWNINDSPSEMGYFTELIREKEESIRTVHPFYSFACLGAQAEEYGRVHSRDTFSRDYLFGTLHDVNAKMMIIGLEYNHSWTFSHYIEQQQSVDYRYKKPFSGKMVINGKEYYDEYLHYVRDLSRGIETHVNPMGDRLEQDGIVSTAKIANKEFKLGAAKPMYDRSAELMQTDERLMYRITDDS
jgi:aminoglycoside 3-N-acetyltransferase